MGNSSKKIDIERADGVKQGYWVGNGVDAPDSGVDAPPVGEDANIELTASSTPEAALAKYRARRLLFEQEEERKKQKEAGVAEEIEKINLRTQAVSKAILPDVLAYLSENGFKILDDTLGETGESFADGISSSIAFKRDGKVVVEGGDTIYGEDRGFETYHYDSVVSFVESYFIELDEYNANGDSYLAGPVAEEQPFRQIAVEINKINKEAYLKGPC